MNGTSDADAEGGDGWGGGESGHAPPMSRRRRVLGSLGALLATGLAGCTGSDGGDGGTTTRTDGDGDGETPPAGSGTADDETTGGETTDDGTTEGEGPDDGTTEGETTGPGTTTTTDPGARQAVSARGPTGDLDLREANVTGVEFDPSDGSYRVSVTLYHDDEGEEGYANWWQVETRAGDRLGRRELLHPHGTREFTRSATVEIPPEVSTVVVRGHDQTHGYGGQAAVVDLVAGEAEFVDQGPDPDDFAG